MTIQQAFTRCVPAILTGDKAKIIEAFSNTAIEYLNEKNIFAPYFADAKAFENKVYALPPAKQAMIAAIVEVLSK